MFCSEIYCYEYATRVRKNRVLCEGCFLDLPRPEHPVTVEFCTWIQDTQVFEMFTNHLNKGMKLENLNVNKPLAKKARAGC